MIEKFNETIREIVGTRNMYNEYSLKSLGIDTSKLTADTIKIFRRNLDFLLRINKQIENSLNN